MCDNCGKCKCNVAEPPSTVIVVTLRITPEKGRWGPRIAGGLAKGLVSFANDWCENNNRDAAIDGTWAVYEGAER